MTYLISINFSAIGQFQLQPINLNIEGVRGSTLSLEWEFRGITKMDKVYEAKLYFNVTMAIPQALICEWNTTSDSPQLTTTGRNIFSNRVSVLYKSGIYNFTLTELQHNDTGQYFLKVAVGPKDVIASSYRESIITISTIKGKYILFISCFFLASI